MSNNLADLILNHRSSLSTLIAAYDAATAGAEARCKERIETAAARYERECDEAEASFRVNTGAARDHFDEGLRRAGITLFDLQAQDDATDFTNVGHLPEPLPTGTFRRWDEVALNGAVEGDNATGEAEPETLPDSGARGLLEPLPVEGERDEIARGDSHGPSMDSAAVDAPLCANCGKAISPSFVKQGLKKCWRCYGKKSTDVQSPEPPREAKPATVAPKTTTVEVLPCKIDAPTKKKGRPYFLADEDEYEAPPDKSDYLINIRLADNMPENDRALLNAEIHAGLATFKPRRFEIHQDIATGAYYAVDYRHETEPGSRAILWMQYHEGKPFPTFFPAKGGIK